MNTYKIKYSFFHSALVSSNNIQGYSGVAGTEYDKETYLKLLETDKELSDRFEVSGIIPNAIKTLAELKAEAEEIMKLIAEKEKQENPTQTKENKK